MTGSSPSRWRWLAATLLTAPLLLAVPAAAQQPGVTVSESMLGPLTEGVPLTSRGTYTVVLNTGPTGAVMLRVMSSNAAVVVDTDLTPLRRDLTFTTMNWATAQTVTATAASDLNAVDERVTLTHTLTGAAEYTTVTVAPVTVQVTDDEDPALRLTPSNLAVAEGSSTAYTMRLETEPAGDVLVQVRSDNADVALQAAGQATAVETLSLIFVRDIGIGSNAWNRARAVTVHALTDTNAVNESVTLTHTATGGDYGTVTKTLTVAVTDTTTALTNPPGDVTPAFAAATLPAQTYKTQQRVQVQLPAATTGDPPLTYTLTPTLPAMLTYDGSTRRIMGAAQAAMAATVYTHMVTDADGDNASQTVSITIENPQQMFMFSESAHQQYMRYTPSVPYALPAPNRGDGGLLFFAVTTSLPAGLGYTPPTPSAIIGEGMRGYRYSDGGMITGTPDAALPTSTYTLTVTAADQAIITLDFQLNRQPSFGDATVPPQEYPEGMPIPTLTLPEATGGDGLLTYAEPMPALPAGLTYMRPAPTDETGGTITGTPTAPMAAGTYRLTVGDDDGDTARLSFQLAVDGRPRFGGLFQREVRQGSPVSLELPKATGGDRPLTYTLMPTPALPVGLTYTEPALTDETGGTIAGTPTAVMSSTTYTLTVTDADGDQDTLPITLAVSMDPMPRFEDALVERKCTQGTPCRRELPAATGGDRPLTYTLMPTPALPVGLTYTEPALTDETGGTIAGTPTAVTEEATYTLTATDADGDQDTLMVTFAVVEDLMPRFEDALVERECPQGTPCRRELPAAIGGNTPLTYTLMGALPLPVGLTYTEPPHAPKGGTITGTATAVTEETTYTLTATDADGDQDTLMVTFAVVVEDLMPHFEAPVEKECTQGTPCLLQLPAAIGGDRPLTYTLMADLPVGLTYTRPPDAPKGGTISGTPTVATPAATYRLTVTDADGDQDTLPITLVVVEDLMPSFEGATIDSQVYPQGVQIEPLPLPRATGGNGTLSYTLTPALPEGLMRTLPTETSDGTITGTPTELQDMITYTLTVRDEDGDTDSITFSIEVTAAIQSQDLALVLAGIGRTLAADAVEILSGRFGSSPASRLHVTLGGQVLRLTDPAQSAPAPAVAASAPRGEAGHGEAVTCVAHSSMPGSPSPLAGAGRGLHARDLPVQRQTGAQAGERGAAPAAPAPRMEWRGVSGPRASDAPAPSGPSSLDAVVNDKRPVRASDSPAAGPCSASPLSAHHSPLSTGPWQRVTGVALGVARALGVTLDTPTLPPAAAGAGSAPSPLGPRHSLPSPGSSLFRLRAISAKDLLSRSAFELPLTRTGDTGVPAWTLWGRGSAAGFSGQPEEGFTMDGTLYSGYAGVDYRPQSTVLLGLAVSHSTGEANYERIGATKAGVDVELTSMLPYAHWQPRPGLGLWSLLGVGWGNLAIKVDGDTQTRHTALTSHLVAVGGRQALTTWQGIDLAAKTDAFLTTVRSTGRTNLPAARGHAQRMRLLMEGRTAVDVSSVSRVQPRLEVGGRWDSGTAEQGLGLELGGGVAYTRTDWGLSVDAQGRYLLVHEDGAFEDWGASVNVRLDPGMAGAGVYLTAAPVWGQAASGVDQLWSPAAALSQGSGPARPPAGWQPDRLAVDLGYGLALDGRGVLTPYGGLDLTGPGSSRYRLGSHLALSSSLNVNIEAERADQPGQKTAHGVSVQLGWQW